jgi:hypothetical protein
MPGLDPGIRSTVDESSPAAAEWIAGSSPAMPTTGDEAAVAFHYEEARWPLP